MISFVLLFFALNLLQPQYQSQTKCLLCADPIHITMEEMLPISTDHPQEDNEDTYLVFDASKAPNVIITHILSFLPLTVGHGSSDSFIRVSQQWLICSRAITRPCIEWTGTLQDNVSLSAPPLSAADRRKQRREKKQKTPTPTPTPPTTTAPSSNISPLALIRRKYPNVIHAYSLIGWSPDRVQVKELLSSSLLSSLRSLEFRVYSKESGDMIELDQLADLCRRIATTNPSFRDVSLWRPKRRQANSGQDLICAAACQLLQPYQDDNNNTNEVTKSLSSLVPSTSAVGRDRPLVTYNGALSHRCDKCNKWSWALSCAKCPESMCIICDIDNGIAEFATNDGTLSISNYFALNICMSLCISIVDGEDYCGFCAGNLMNLPRARVVCDIISNSLSASTR
jgi:hypothetical protein